MKISTVLFVKYLTFVVLVKVGVLGEEMKCDKDSRRVACPEVICNLINNRKFDNFCKDIQCDGIVRGDCPKGTVFEEGLTMCGCCPGCAKYLGLGDPCEVASPVIDVNCTASICPIIMNECSPGLFCNYLGEFSKKCDIDTKPSNDKSCIFKRNQGLNGQIHWVPDCDPDDPTKYLPKQCKGSRSDGTCFCVDPDGNRIFGREWWNEAEKKTMTCGCSRRVFNLREEGNIATIHCSSDGNYEPLQCDMDSGLCYCVDTVTGELNGAILPEHQWQLLPCYSVNLTNFDPTGQYLRQCESEWGAGQRIRNEGLLHGVDVYAVTDFKCDYDGSFSAKRRHNALEYCVPKTGNINENGGHYQMLGQKYMDCQCFRDAIVYAEQGRPFLRICDTQTGNYNIISQTNQPIAEYLCVDKDGFFYGDAVPGGYECCLTDDCVRSDIKAKCYDPVLKTGDYKSCSLFSSYEPHLYI